MAVATKVGPASVYVATNSPSEPVCAYGASTGKREGLAVSMYFSKKGRLKGVVVIDMDSDESVFVGSVPNAAILDGVLEDAETALA